MLSIQLLLRQKSVTIIHKHLVNNALHCFKKTVVTVFFGPCCHNKENCLGSEKRSWHSMNSIFSFHFLNIFDHCNCFLSLTQFSSVSSVFWIPGFIPHILDFLFILKVQKIWKLPKSEWQYDPSLNSIWNWYVILFSYERKEQCAAFSNFSSSML